MVLASREAGSGDHHAAAGCLKDWLRISPTLALDPPLFGQGRRNVSF